MKYNGNIHTKSELNSILLFSFPANRSTERWVQFYRSAFLLCSTELAVHFYRVQKGVSWRQVSQKGVSLWVSEFWA